MPNLLFRARHCCASFVFFFAVICAPASAALLSVQSEARDPVSGHLLYREDHLVRGVGDLPSKSTPSIGRPSKNPPAERVVLYRCPDGTAFARKRVDYAASAIAPAFSLIDARDGYREGMRRSGTTIEVWSGAKQNTLTGGDGVLADGMLVADAGFDEYLRGHWDVLLSKGSLPIRFVVPSFGKALGFNVSSVGTSAIDGTPIRTFRLKVGGMLGLIAPTIDVAYDARDRSLRRFTGVSNIRADGGKALRTRIDFAKPPISVDDARWQTALTTPLKRCALGG